MAKKSALEIIKKIGLSFRRNWGLKLISLGFAVILWNYVIAEINPIGAIPFNGIKVTFDDNGLTRLKNSGFTVSGALPDIKVNVAINLPRNETLGPDDIKAVVDLSRVNTVGPFEAKVNVIPARGSVASISQGTITVNIERLDQRAIPVHCVFEGALPPDYWRGDPVISPSSVLQISGATSLVSRVASARIVIPLSGLKEKLSSAKDFILLDSDGVEISRAGLEFSSPNCIVDLQVFPTKKVRIDIENSLKGSVAKGYEITEMDVVPADVIIAGPQEVLDTIHTLVLAKPINISGAKEPISESNLMLKLHPDIRIVGENSINVFLNIKMKMTTVIINDVHITIDLAPGLKVKQAFTADVTITCPELFVSKIKRSQVHLAADATALGVGNHTLTVKGTYGDPDALAEIIDISPNEIPVKIESKTTP